MDFLQCADSCSRLGDDENQFPSLPMSEQQFKGFWKAIQADAALQQKLEGGTGPDAIVTIAKEAGFCISADELKKAESEIPEDELEGVAGGKERYPIMQV